MILQRLKEFWDRQDDTFPRGYQLAFLTKKIVIDSAGNRAHVEALSGEKRGQRSGLSYPVPREQPQRTSSVRPRLLQDNPEYALGFVGEGRDPAKVKGRHEAYVHLLREAAAETNEQSLASVLRWIDGSGPQRLLDAHAFEVTDDLLFQVAEDIPTDLPSVRRFWAKDTEGPQGYCLVTGELTAVGAAMPYPAKGVPGGQTSGTMLVSVNMPAGESYGLSGNLSSPIGSEAAESICNALNRLLSDPRHSLRVQNTVYVFWTRDPQPDFSWDILNRPNEEEVRLLIDRARTGGEVSKTDAADFFALSLSANASRIVVRDYHETTLPSVKRKLGEWFDRLSIIGVDGRPARPPGVFALSASLYRDRKDIPNHVPVELIRSALTGSPFPEDLLLLAVRRNTATQGPFYRQNNQRYESLARLALIKAALTRNQEGRTDLTQLNKSHPDAAYHCGRLLSVLESIQRLAIPGLNATLTDRHYGAACASPGTIFGGLLKDATSAHLPKLRKNRPGAFVALDSRLQEVLSGVGNEFPMTLDYRNQGLFALGYYHQRAHDIAQARANKEMKELAEGVQPDRTEEEQKQ